MSSEHWSDNPNSVEDYTVHGKSPEQMSPVEMMLKGEEEALSEFVGEKEQIADLYMTLTDRALTAIVNDYE